VFRSSPDILPAPHYLQLICTSSSGTSITAFERPSLHHNTLLSIFSWHYGKSLFTDNHHTLKS